MQMPIVVNIYHKTISYFQGFFPNLSIISSGVEGIKEYPDVATTWSTNIN